MRRSIVNTPLLYLNPCPLPVTSTGDKGPTRKNHHLASNSQFSPKGQRCATCDKQRQRGGFGDRRNLRGHSNRIDIHAGSRGSRDGFTPADGKGIDEVAMVVAAAEVTCMLNSVLAVMTEPPL